MQKISRTSNDQARIFSLREFGEARLGDRRLDHRLQIVAQELMMHPEQSLPQAAGSAADSKAIYRFCDNDKVVREKILKPHYDSTKNRMGDEEDILVVEDTTTLNFTHHPATEGLGHIASKNRGQLQGALVHSALAVRASNHEVLGLLDQAIIIREEYLPPDKPKSINQNRKKESEKWASGAMRVVERVGKAGRLIFVFDREGDVFEAIEELQKTGARFVIRAMHSRRIESIEESRYTFDSVRTAPQIAVKEIVVPRGKGKKERKAVLTLRAVSCRIMTPINRRSHPRISESREVNMVSIREENPPPGTEAIEWILMTTEPIKTAEDVLRIVDHYIARWKIEEWHKALKTGCRIETRQLEEWDRLDVLLGIYSVIAWKMLAMRDAARSGLEISSDVLSEIQKEILQRIDPKIDAKSSSGIMLIAVAKLGGFLGRKGDGIPGWLTLWRGFTRLLDIEVGYSLHKVMTCG